MEAVEFHEGRHEYRAAGEVRRSVTQILSAWQPDDLLSAQESGRLLPEHAQIGTMRHLVTELDDAGDLDESTLDDGLRPTLDAWRAFRARSGFEPEQIEWRFFWETENYAGTIDRVGRIKGRRVLIDQKGASKSSTNGLQLVAYALAWESLNDEVIDSIACVHIDPRAKDGYRVVSYDADRPRLERDWLILCRAHEVHMAGRYKFRGLA